MQVLHLEGGLTTINSDPSSSTRGEDNSRVTSGVEGGDSQNDSTGAGGKSVSQGPTTVTTTASNGSVGGRIDPKLPLGGEGPQSPAKPLTRQGSSGGANSVGAGRNVN